VAGSTHADSGDSSVRKSANLNDGFLDFRFTQYLAPAYGIPLVHQSGQYGFFEFHINFTSALGFPLFWQCQARQENRLLHGRPPSSPG
jgi:hypothetical protein